MAFFGCGGPVGSPPMGAAPPAVVVPPPRRKNAGGVNPHFGRRRVGVPTPRRVGVSAGPCPAHWSWLGGALLLVGTMRGAYVRPPSITFRSATYHSGCICSPSLHYIPVGDLITFADVADVISLALCCAGCKPESIESTLPDVRRAA